MTMKDRSSAGFVRIPASCYVVRLSKRSIAILFCNTDVCSATCFRTTWKRESLSILLNCQLKRWVLFCLVMLYSETDSSASGLEDPVGAEEAKRAPERSRAWNGGGRGSQPRAGPSSGRLDERPKNVFFSARLLGQIIRKTCYSAGMHYCLYLGLF